MDLNQTIDEITARIGDDLTAIWHAIHQHPEIGFEEVETAKRVSATLEKLGIPHRTGVGKTGVVGLIEGGGPGKTIGIRADMDALPVQEKSRVSFASKIPGRMHACGHDTHTVMVLGAAMVLNELSEPIQGRVKLIFQPAEELLIGAPAMIEDGVLEDPKMDAILGLHNWITLAAGQVAYNPDVTFAASDAFDLTLKGLSGHAAHPHTTIDTITNAAYFITQLQSIVSREIIPVSPAVISIGRIEGGTVRNIIPDSVTLQGTVRTLDGAISEQIEAAIRRLLDGLKAGMRVDYELDYRRLVPVVRNDPELLATVLDSVRDILGAEHVEQLPAPPMGSEDFAFFSEAIPAAHLRIGSKSEDLDTAAHRNTYECDPLAIPTGVRAISRAALDLLS
jgi:amidohydrolase